jgi:hypothetical protein
MRKLVLILCCILIPVAAFGKPWYVCQFTEGMNPEECLDENEKTDDVCLGEDDNDDDDLDEIEGVKPIVIPGPSGMSVEEFLGLFGISEAVHGIGVKYHAGTLKLGDAEYPSPALKHEFCYESACYVDTSKEGTYTFRFKETNRDVTYSSGTFKRKKISGYGELIVVEGTVEASGRKYRFGSFKFSSGGKAKVQASVTPDFSDVINPINQVANVYNCSVVKPLLMGRSKTDNIIKPKPIIRVMCTQPQ